MHYSTKTCINCNMYSLKDIRYVMLQLSPATSTIRTRMFSEITKIIPNFGKVRNAQACGIFGGLLGGHIDGLNY